MAIAPFLGFLGRCRSIVGLGVLSIQWVICVLDRLIMWKKNSDFVLLSDVIWGNVSIQEICAAFDVKEETYKTLMQKGQQMLTRCPKSAETNIDQDINNLKEKWESVETKLNERKVCALMNTVE